MAEAHVRCVPMHLVTFSRHAVVVGPSASAPSVVMPGPWAGYPRLPLQRRRQGVDTRAKRGHDGGGWREALRPSKSPYDAIISNRSIPIRIVGRDHPHLACARPVLDGVLALDGRADIVELLEINQPLHAIPFGEAFNGFRAMFEDTADKIVGDPDIEDTIGAIAQDVDVPAHDETDDERRGAARQVRRLRYVLSKCLAALGHHAASCWPGRLVALSRHARAWSATRRSRVAGVSPP